MSDFTDLKNVEVYLQTQGNTPNILNGKFYHFWKLKFKSIVVTVFSNAVGRNYMVPKPIFVYLNFIND